MAPKRAFWEAFAKVCLRSLLVWTILAYLLRSKLNLPYAEALPIYLFLAILPVPLAFPIYRRQLKGASGGAKQLSPQSYVVCATFFAFAAIMQGMGIPRLLRNHKDVWDLILHIATPTVWLVLSIEYFRRAVRKHSASSGM
jgi:hypothetical protein